VVYNDTWCRHSSTKEMSEHYYTEFTQFLLIKSEWYNGDSTSDKLNQMLKITLDLMYRNCKNVKILTLEVNQGIKGSS
jgi:2-polyprenyl-3-methyl-5-hydroxy-6-metoxy-1,4-benzoquinol methylase